MVIIAVKIEEREKPPERTEMDTRGNKKIDSLDKWKRKWPLRDAGNPHGRTLGILVWKFFFLKKTSEESRGGGSVASIKG